MYSYPKTNEEYWNVVDKYWEDIYNILFTFLPKDQLKDADTFRTLKDPEIARLFNAAWANAPDSPHIHSIPSWHILCDLCSEDFLLYETEDYEGH
jgi:hypothetical protein